MSVSLKSLQDKTVLIFGAGSSENGPGNGAAIAVRMAEHGATVIIADKDPEAARRTQQRIAGCGGRGEVVKVDVRDETQVKEAVQFSEGVRGRVDVLVNNVGIVTLGGPEDLATPDWDLAFEVNVRSAFLACKHVLPGMRKAGGGSIIQISSVAGIRWSGTAYCAYTASKAAMNALGMSIAMQYAGEGIRCNNLLLGLIDTPLVRQQLAFTDPHGIEHLLASRNAVCPTGAMGTAWDVADTALFLAGSESRYINGADIVIDGGLHNQVAPPPRFQKE